LDLTFNIILQYKSAGLAAFFGLFYQHYNNRLDFIALHDRVTMNSELGRLYWPISRNNLPGTTEETSGLIFKPRT